MRCLRRWTLVFSLLGCCAITRAESLPARTAAQQVLQQHCVKCHGAEKQSSALDLRTEDAMRLGGKRGPVITPGNAKASRLWQVLQVGAKPHMPPGKKQLAVEEMQVIAAWLDSLPAAPQTAPQESAVDDPPASFLPPPRAEPHTVIDLYLQAGYAKWEVTPNGRAADDAFLRRLSLDLLGRIPTPEERRAFGEERDSGKRDQWIDRWLASPEHAQRLASVHSTLLMGRVEGQLRARAQHGWDAYLERAFADNRPWDQVVQEVLLGRGTAKDRGHLWFLYERKDKHQDIAEAVARGFFGVDIACAQCHDHPLAGEIEQKHYWGLVAFFKRSKNSKGAHGIAVAESAIGGFDDFTSALAGTSHPAVLTFLEATEVPEPRPAKEEKQEDAAELYRDVVGEPREPLFSRREKFVQDVVVGHPRVARAQVNRLWALVMGRGLVHPLDQMDSDHPPSHPELLDWLARDFAEHGYDVRRTLRAILRSAAYQQSSRQAAGGVPQAFHYAHEKPLTAEQTVRSLAVALALPEEEVAQELGAGLRDWIPEIVDEERLTTLKQTMALSNAPQLEKLLRRSAAAMVETPGSDEEKLVRRFVRVMGRAPDAEERTRLVQYLAARDDPRNAYAQVLWALTTSAEFRFNH